MGLYVIFIEKLEDLENLDWSVLDDLDKAVDHQAAQESFMRIREESRAYWDGHDSNSYVDEDGRVHFVGLSDE